MSVPLLKFQEAKLSVTVTMAVFNMIPLCELAA